MEEEVTSSYDDNLLVWQWRNLQSNCNKRLFSLTSDLLGSRKAPPTLLCCFIFSCLLEVWGKKCLMSSGRRSGVAPSAQQNSEEDREKKVVCFHGDRIHRAIHCVAEGLERHDRIVLFRAKLQIKRPSSNVWLSPSQRGADSWVNYEVCVCVSHCTLLFHTYTLLQTLISQLSSSLSWVIDKILHELMSGHLPDLQSTALNRLSEWVVGRTTYTHSYHAVFG